MPRSRRSPNRITDDRLVDDVGNEWYRVDRELTRDDVLQMLADPAVRVGVHAQRALVRWIPAADRDRVWREEIEPNFLAPATAARPPFHGTRWRRRGTDLLVFDDFD